MCVRREVADSFFLASFFSGALTVGLIMVDGSIKAKQVIF
jgi:hypothetical protein